MIRTDLPLDPVPFAERMASPLWDILRVPHSTEHKLTREDAADIRHAHYVEHASIRLLADWYGVSKTVVHNIVTGKTYKEAA